MLTAPFFPSKWDLFCLTTYYGHLSRSANLANVIVLGFVPWAVWMALPVACL